MIGLVIKFFNSGPIKEVEGSIINVWNDWEILYIKQLNSSKADSAILWIDN